MYAPFSMESGRVVGTISAAFADCGAPVASCAHADHRHATERTATAAWKRKRGGFITDFTIDGGSLWLG